MSVPCSGGSYPERVRGLSVREIKAAMNRKLLIYTDSRGQHTPRGAPAYDVFALRLAQRPDVEAKVALCPMKWTSTIDFLDYLDEHKMESYDHIILYTGIVEWSPRPQASAISDLYDNKAPHNLANGEINTRDYSRKVINNKKASFDAIFGEKAMRRHLGRDFGVEFEGQPTVNMYSLEMAEKHLIPRLAALDNLIFINSNRFIPGWEGDFARGRPTNIGLTEQYSALFRDALGVAKVIDLLKWDEVDIRKFTCDNLHLTKAGSDLIYDTLCDRIGLTKKAFSSASAKMNGAKEKNDCVKMSNRDGKISQQGHELQLRADSILIIGNGPSAKKLAEFGLHNLPTNIDTFGMGAAYRYFREIGWWPTYYAWCDAKVVHSHRNALTELIGDSEISTRTFYFSLPISEHPRFQLIPHCSTGDFCFRKSVEFGYKNIYLIGIEGDYVEEISGSRPLTDQEYEGLGFPSLFPLFEHIAPEKEEAFRLFRDNLRIIERTPEHNPNYFFDSYQRAGDVYSLPRAQTHKNSWRKSAAMAQENSVIVVNLSEDSKITHFPKLPWEAFTAYLSEPKPSEPAFAPYGRPMELPTPLTPEDRVAALTQAGLTAEQKLATLVIGVRFPDGDPIRSHNLLVLLNWIDRFYSDLFDVLLIEQDSTSKINTVAEDLRPYVRHEFIYNPHAFNRGWGYNAGVRHFTDAKVVALLDTDILPGANFVQEVIDCHHQYKVVSPYTSVYYTDPAEAMRVAITFCLDHIRSADRIKKPTTISGGILIIRRETFVDVAGFEQYIEFAGEDRALDVTLLNFCAPAELRVAPYTYAHLHHSSGNELRPRSKELFTHVHDNYGCRHDPSLTPADDIHKTCKHVLREKTSENTQNRRPFFGDLDLYRSKRLLTINGCYAGADPEPPKNEDIQPEVIFPPAFKNLDHYPARELYEAPEPDSKTLSKLYNAYKGKRCFIIGNGPSLNKHDLSLLRDEYSFAVNSIYYKTDETGFRPTFFVVEDDAVLRENVERIRSYEAPFKFFPTNYVQLVPSAPNVFFFRMNRGFYEKSSPNYCVPRFSTDASKVLFCGQSVTYINLQLAFFMGFTEVFLIGMDFEYVIPDSHGRKGDFIYSTTDDPNHFHKEYFGKGKTWKDPKLERVATNYRQAKLTYESVGRRIYNASIGGRLEIFERVDYERLLKAGVKATPLVASSQAVKDAARPEAPELPRSSQAYVIETEVISNVLENRRGPDRVMIDVGAHVGLTASFFNKLGWTVHCFEPDPANREKLVARFGEAPNVTIDPRAVSDKPAKGLAFFTSEESTGISALHAFRETHREIARVDVTTVADIVAERKLSRIDFLKIDVEGFDFAVLKGVPWERLAPDVIECEFEDAKTIPLGHNWRDIAELLRGKGYTVYISEWHPIVRYGIAHDWRRIVPYPGVDIDKDAWGNLLAFREDPGFETVHGAFRDLVKTRAPAPVKSEAKRPPAGKAAAADRRAPPDRPANAANGPAVPAKAAPAPGADAPAPGGRDKRIAALTARLASVEARLAEITAQIKKHLEG